MPLDVDADRQFLLLRVVVQAQNLRTTRVCINQICSVYCIIWREADGEEIWQGFASIMFGDLRKHDRVARFHTMAVEQDEEWIAWESLGLFLQSQASHFSCTCILVVLVFFLVSQSWKITKTISFKIWTITRQRVLIKSG